MRRTTWRTGVMVTVVVVAGALHTARADDAELAHLAAEIEARERAMLELGRQEKSITRALGELDESLARLDEQGARLEQEVREAGEKLAAAEQGAAQATGQLEKAEDRLRGRLRGVYALGPSADLQVVLGSRSLAELVWRRAVLRRLAEHDAQLAADVSGRRAALLAERTRLQAERLALEERRAALAVARKTALEARASRAATLIEVGTQKGAAQRRLEELGHARRRLKALVDELPAGATGSGFASLKGQLPWPTSGRVDVPFGPRADPETGVETLHGGVSIDAPLGQRVITVARGRVVHAGWLRGFGQLLIVDHGDGFHSLAAHLSRITVQAGDEVADGDVVGFVGDSESLVGPRLYFELRHKGRPVDPTRWLTH